MSEPREVASVVPDPTALKALAHPMRLRILSLLRVEGPSTATALALRFGLNSGATSYHLRTLAKHGFVEDDAQGTGRERWWRAKHQSTHFNLPGSSKEALESGHAFAQAAMDEQIRMMQAAHAALPDLPTEWQEATDVSDFIIAMTPQEAIALRERIHAMLMEAKAAGPALGQDLPEGYRPVMVVHHAFPLPGAKK